MIHIYHFITPNCITKWLLQPHSELEARRGFFVLRSGVWMPTCRVRDYFQKLGAVSASHNPQNRQKSFQLWDLSKLKLLGRFLGAERALNVCQTPGDFAPVPYSERWIGASKQRGRLAVPARGDGLRIVLNNTHSPFVLHILRLAWRMLAFHQLLIFLTEIFALLSVTASHLHPTSPQAGTSPESHIQRDLKHHLDGGANTTPMVLPPLF